jgi:tRNA (guanine37-N1)-methyltransferase
VLSIGVITLFPEIFAILSDYGVTGRAIKKGLVELRAWDLRNFTKDRHRTVDDRPYGGGPGMVMMFEPLQAAIRSAEAVLGGGTHVVALTPQGRRLDQHGVGELVQRERLY